MRTAPIGSDGRLDRSCQALLSVSVPGLVPEYYRIACWDTEKGCTCGEERRWLGQEGPLTFCPPPISGDLAIAISLSG